VIKAKFKAEDGRITMTMRGHSGAAERGKDLVCAAASMLAFTVSQDIIDQCNAGNLQEHPDMHVSPGKVEISVIPKEDNYAEILHTFFIIQKGLLVLQANHPKFVKVSPFTC
jgi:uncharacterized protein YsxB (DUF464 family)